MTGRRLILTLVLLFALSGQLSAASTPLIVQLTPTASVSGVLSFLGGSIVDSIPDANLYLINASQVPTTTSLFSLLGIQWIEVNIGVSLPPMGQLGVLQLTPSAAA